jgi:hypothetical protein
MRTSRTGDDRVRALMTPGTWPVEQAAETK